MAISLEQFTQFVTGTADEHTRREITQDLFSSGSTVRAELDICRDAGERLLGLRLLTASDELAASQIGAILHDGIIEDVPWTARGRWMVSRLLAYLMWLPLLGWLGYACPYIDSRPTRIIVATAIPLLLIARAGVNSWIRGRPPWGTVWDAVAFGAFVLLIFYWIDRLVVWGAESFPEMSATIRWWIWAVGALLGLLSIVAALELGIGNPEHALRRTERLTVRISDWLVLSLVFGGGLIACTLVLVGGYMAPASSGRLAAEVFILGAIFCMISRSPGADEWVVVHSGVIGCLRMAAGVMLFTVPVMGLSVIPSWIYGDPIYWVQQAGVLALMCVAGCGAAAVVSDDEWRDLCSSMLGTYVRIYKAIVVALTAAAVIAAFTTDRDALVWWQRVLRMAAVAGSFYVVAKGIVPIPIPRGVGSAAKWLWTIITDKTLEGGTVTTRRTDRPSVAHAVGLFGKGVGQVGLAGANIAQNIGFVFYWSFANRRRWAL